MAKTPYTEVVQRINAAQVLLRRYTSLSKVIKLLVERYRVSGRQAYRYIVQAQKSKGPLPIPEEKIVFTVKLPLSLADCLRQQARLKGISLSTMVTHALDLFLKRVKYGR